MTKENNNQKKGTTEIVADYIAKELTQRKKNYLEFIAPIATLIAALGALLGAYTAYDVAKEAKEIQKQINERQIRINENGRISNLWIKHKFHNCPTIDVEDTSKWELYGKCVNGGVKVDLNKFRFFQVKNKTRFDCLVTLNICVLKPQPGFPTNNDLYNKIDEIQKYIDR